MSMPQTDPPKTAEQVLAALAVIAPGLTVFAEEVTRQGGRFIHIECPNTPKRERLRMVEAFKERGIQAINRDGGPGRRRARIYIPISCEEAPSSTRSC